MTEVVFKSEWAMEYPFPSEYSCQCGKSGKEFHLFQHKSYEGHKCERCFIKHIWPDHQLAHKE